MPVDSPDWRSASRPVESNRDQYLPEQLGKGEKGNPPRSNSKPACYQVARLGPGRKQAPSRPAV